MQISYDYISPKEVIEIIEKLGYGFEEVCR